MPGESVEGSNSRNWLLVSTEKQNSSETGKLELWHEGLLLYDLGVPKHDVRHSKWGHHDGSSCEGNGIGGLNQGAYAIG